MGGKKQTGDSGELEPKAPPGPRSGAHGLPEELRTSETVELVDLAQGGEIEALNALFQRYHGFMVEVARKRLGSKLRTKEDADDLAQTTFREATRDFDRYEYRGRGSLLRWLLQILHNKIRDKAEYYSAGKRDVSRERRMDDLRPEDEDAPRAGRRDPPSDEISVTRAVQRKEEFEILRQALEDLSPDHRKAITLVFFEGMSLRQAGERMGGRSEDAVRMLLRRAESRLHDLTKTRLGS